MIRTGTTLIQTHSIKIDWDFPKYAQLHTLDGSEFTLLVRMPPKTSRFYWYIVSYGEYILDIDEDTVDSMGWRPTILVKGDFRHAISS